MLLSGRPVRGVRRIWADGKLLRGAAGDFKSHTGFRLHTGGEEQAVDPLIASAEAMQCPAYRGMAYAVFEQMALADFGNRIPSLTFELDADAGPVSIAAIVTEMSGGAMIAAAGEATAALPGFSAYGGSIAGVAATIADATGIWFADGGDRIAVRSGIGASIEIADQGYRPAGRDKAGSGRSFAAPDRVPQSLTLGYYDPARDYQTGLQRAWRPGAGSGSGRIELPAAIEAAGAAGLAEAALARIERERETRRVSIGWRGLTIGPGDRLTIAGEGGIWRATEWTFEAMAVRLTLKRIAAAPTIASETGDPGRVLGATDEDIGATRVEAFEIPPIDESVPAMPRLTIAACGTGPGWRGAELILGDVAGTRRELVGTARLAAVIGTLVSAPDAAPSSIEDRRNAVEVDLAHAGMMLADADDGAIDRGANLALIGDELIQFGRAEPIGGVRWRLSGLWRGRRGTEDAVAGHAAGKRFVLIDAEAMTVIDLPSSAIGTALIVEAAGVGDGDAAATAKTMLSGRSIVPPSPLHLRGYWVGETLLALTWVRRSRAGWAWNDGADVPLIEERERYRVRTIDDSGASETIESDSADAVVAVSPGRPFPIAIEVRQIGTHGLSAPAYRTVSSVLGAIE